MARLSCSRVAVAVSAALALAAFSSPAQAGPQQPNQDWFQDQPPEPPSSKPATAIGGVNGGRDFAGPNTPPPLPPAGPRMAPQNAAAQSDFPDDSVHDWVVAYARMARSRAMLHRAENDLDHAVRNAQLNFEQSHEYREAVAAEKQAYEAYNAERGRALKSVLDNPRYVAALELRDKMADQITHVRADSHRSKNAPVPNEILMAMASQKLQFATDAHNIESAALDKDDKLKDLRQRMVDANARVSELRAQFDASVRTNSEIAQARRNVEDARVAVVTAEAYQNAAWYASSIATDYSYYRHRWDGLVGPQVALGPWGY